MVQIDERLPKHLIKAELARRGMKVKDLVEKLRPYGENLTDLSFNNKMSRGGFSALFFLKCMLAMGVESLPVATSVGMLFASGMEGRNVGAVVAE